MGRMASWMTMGAVVLGLASVGCDHDEPNRPPVTDDGGADGGDMDASNADAGNDPAECESVAEGNFESLTWGQGGGCKAGGFCFAVGTVEADGHLTMTSEKGCIEGMLSPSEVGELIEALREPAFLEQWCAGDPPRADAPGGFLDTAAVLTIVTSAGEIHSEVLSSLEEDGGFTRWSALLNELLEKSDAASAACPSGEE